MATNQKIDIDSIIKYIETENSNIKGIPIRGAKIVKSGGSYRMTVDKAYIDNGLVPIDESYDIIILRSVK